MEKKKLLRLVPVVIVLGIVGSMVAVMFGHEWLIGVILGALFGLPFLIGIVIVILSVAGVIGKPVATSGLSAEEKARRKRDSRLISSSGYRKNGWKRIPVLVVLIIIGCVAGTIASFDLGQTIAGICCFLSIFVIVFSCLGIVKLVERKRKAQEKDSEHFAVVFGVVKACLMPTDEVILNDGVTYTEYYENVAYNGMYKLIVETKDDIRVVFGKDVVANGNTVKLLVNKRNCKTRII